MLSVFVLFQLAMMKGQIEEQMGQLELARQAYNHGVSVSCTPVGRAGLHCR